jgi:hypothetical protein
MEPRHVMVSPGPVVETRRRRAGFFSSAGFRRQGNIFAPHLRVAIARSQA